ncbi:hypothetical protein TNCV_1775421 [Trichonephila clavipes]|nr:hypothetical protein TNCV_1775421 [Trichonephila clavipes]
MASLPSVSPPPLDVSSRPLQAAFDNIPFSLQTGMESCQTEMRRGGASRAVFTNKPLFCLGTDKVACGGNVVGAKIYGLLRKITCPEELVSRFINTWLASWTFVISDPLQQTISR